MSRCQSVLCNAVFLCCCDDEHADAVHPDSPRTNRKYPSQPSHVLLILSQISLHYLLTFTHSEYGKATSISTITHKITGADKVAGADYDSPVGTRENATFVILARNTDIDGTIRSIRDIEDRFNHKHHYPYVFLNEEPFTHEFKNRISNIVSGVIEFGQIPHDHWFQPSWIDEEKAAKSRKKMEEDRIIYGGSVS